MTGHSRVFRTKGWIRTVTRCGGPARFGSSSAWFRVCRIPPKRVIKTRWTKTAGQWVHVAAVMNNKTAEVKAYIHGEAVADAATITDLPNPEVHPFFMRALSLTSKWYRTSSRSERAGSFSTSKLSFSS
jgi:hypothetical protein